MQHPTCKLDRSPPKCPKIPRNISHNVLESLENPKEFSNIHKNPCLSTGAQTPQCCGKLCPQKPQTRRSYRIKFLNSLSNFILLLLVVVLLFCLLLYVMVVVGSLFKIVFCFRCCCCCCFDCCCVVISLICVAILLLLLL